MLSNVSRTECAREGDLFDVEFAEALTIITKKQCPGPQTLTTSSSTLEEEAGEAGRRPVEAVAGTKIKIAGVGSRRKAAIRQR
jgi:hypothetical protein